MKILIIGAGGMVGQKLVNKLLEPNFNAFNIDEIALQFAQYILRSLMEKLI